MHQNILMLYCRRTMRFSPKKTARLLNMSPSLYREIELGEVLLSYEQAQRLAKLYNTDARYFYAAALQLDQLLCSRIHIQTLKADNERLRADLRKLQEGGISS